jgi:hypothetical protein
MRNLDKYRIEQQTPYDTYDYSTSDIKLTINEDYIFARTGFMCNNFALVFSHALYWHCECSRTQMKIMVLRSKITIIKHGSYHQIERNPKLFDTIIETNPKHRRYLLITRIIAGV